MTDGPASGGFFSDRVDLAGLDQRRPKQPADDGSGRDAASDRPGVPLAGALGAGVGQLLVLVDVSPVRRRVPRVAVPHRGHVLPRNIDNAGRELALLFLELVVHHGHGYGRGRVRPDHLLDAILEGRPRVVNLVHDQHPLIPHLLPDARGLVEPLHLAHKVVLSVGGVVIELERDRENRHANLSAEHAGRDEAPPPNGDDHVGVELFHTLHHAGDSVVDVRVGKVHFSVRGSHARRLSRRILLRLRARHFSCFQR
mmetsp:Transcript_24236/g.57764  ORF Transcript_24236/g.57764 Transcript_24236/m.57764 type:complete len:255 (+) Transcript_24236:217-981(+)